MNRYTPILCALLILTITTSCNNSNGKAAVKGFETELEGTISDKGNACLLSYQLKYDALLTEETVLKATGFSKEVLSVKYSKALKNPVYHSISYRFANKRIGKPTGMDYEVELRDEVALKSIKPMSLIQFRDAYRVVSQEETRDANRRIDDVAEGKSESEEANDKIRGLEDKGVDKETVKGVTVVMKEVFSKVSQSYIRLDDLGDAATWNSFTNSLNVLQKGVQFELLVNVSNVNEENKALAIAIAHKLLDHCK